MIKSVNSSSEWIDVSGSRPYIVPPITFTYPDNPYAGDLFYDFALQEIKVYDGSNWVVIEGHANVGLHPGIENLLNWVGKKINEEAQLDELCDKYPALAEAREQFEAMKGLVSKHDK